MERSANEIRIMIADDSSEFVESTIQFLTTDPDDQIRVIKIVNNGMDAIKYAVSLQPDLILMDINMPNINGYDATGMIKSLKDPPKIIIISVFDSFHNEFAAKKSGADGFVSKMEFDQKIIPLIKKVCKPVRM